MIKKIFLMSLTLGALMTTTSQAAPASSCPQNQICAGDSVAFYRETMSGNFVFGNVDSLSGDGVAKVSLKTLHITTEVTSVHISRLGKEVTDYNGFKVGDIVTVRNRPSIRARITRIYDNGIAGLRVLPFRNASANYVDQLVKDAVVLPR